MRRSAALLLLLALLATRPASADGEEWVRLKTEYEKTFKSLPVKQMFTDPVRELKLSRRAPFTDSAKAEIAQARAKLKLKRARILAERRKREDVVKRIGEFGGPRAADLLMKAYERQLGEVDKAQANQARFDEAAKIDTNPGTDPGSVPWKSWLGGERGSARGVVADEKKLRDLILAQCMANRSPEIIDWVAGHAVEQDRIEVRELMVGSLAKDPDDSAPANLARVYEADAATWFRVMILDTVARRKKTGAASLVRTALADPAWPIRSAAVSAVRALALKDQETIDALVAAMAASDGRVRHEIRMALSAASGDASPPDAPLPRLFGVRTASKRIAILIPRGRAMLKPITRRTLDNAGNPAPEPGVDSALKIAAWELSQALDELDKDVEFVVVVYGGKIHASSKRLVAATKSNKKKALSLARKYPPEGGANRTAAVRHVMRLGVKGKDEDLAYAGEGAVDTVIAVGGLDLRWVADYRRLRRVAFHSVNLSRLAVPKK